MRQRSRFQTARRFLIFWTLFIGIGAVAGALAMLYDPSGKFMGMDAMLPYFQVLPFADRVFQDFTFSGWALLIVNGLTNLTAAGSSNAKKHIPSFITMLTKTVTPSRSGKPGIPTRRR